MVAINRKIAFPRRREELPDPSKPPQAEVNKLQPVLSVRVGSTVKQQFDEFADASPKSRRQIMEDALMQYFQSHQPAA